MDNNELMNKERLKLFVTATLQVSLVSMNVTFIANNMIIPMLFSGFLLSYFWTINVKKVAFGEMLDRIIYASGACLGTGLGHLIAKLF
jgi:hypothetical protein